MSKLARPWYGHQIADPMIKYVSDQLPRSIRDKLSVTLTSDPYHLRALAQFKTKDGQVYECTLEFEEVGTSRVAVKVPEEFLAHLVTVV